ncbi:MAG: hypothetical protein AB7N80_05350 [Bdellovibrionales bacterium]
MGVARAALKLGSLGSDSVLSRSAGEKVQGSQVLFTKKLTFSMMLLTAALVSSLAQAAGMFAALEAHKQNAREPSALNDEFSLYVANLPSQPTPSTPDPRYRRRDDTSPGLPVAATVALPATVGAYEVTNWYFGISKGSVCFPPENAMLNITTLTEEKVTGFLVWQQGYKAEAVRCLDRVLPVNGQCANGKVPDVKPCRDATLILLDFTEAVDQQRKPIEPGVLYEKVRAAISQKR